MKTLPEALQIAREQGLDLVEVAAKADPPVCKIMDYGKYKYEQDQRRKESKRKATNVVIKEMKFRPKIDGHDYDDQDEARRALPRQRARRSSSRSCSGAARWPTPSSGGASSNGSPNGSASSRSSSRLPARTAAT